MTHWRKRQIDLTEELELCDMVVLVAALRVCRLADQPMLLGEP